MQSIAMAQSIKFREYALFMRKIKTLSLFDALE